jgi:DUF4097 and DUF4098 domain-containing protein YvlB
MQRSRTFLFATALVLAAVSNSYADSAPLHRTFKVADGGTLKIDADFGEIKVVPGASGSVTVDVKRAGSADEVKAYGVTFDQQSNTVTITGNYDRPSRLFNWSNNLDVEYKVTVPSRFNVELATSGGDITVGDLQGTANVRTSGGELDLGRISGNIVARTSGGDATVAAAGGMLDVKTSGGSITIGDAAQSVDAKTSGGSIDVKRASGDLKLHTSGGSISVDEALGSVQADTSGGSITARMTRQPRGSSRFSTSGGNVTISLASNIAIDLDAKTSGGDVESTIPLTVLGTQAEGSLAGTINGGGPTVTLRASGGNIKIKKL